MTEAPKTTTVTISTDTMKLLRARAVERGLRYSEYLEELIRDAWERDNSSAGRSGRNSKGLEKR